jgi:hypothetical protein
VASQRFGLGLVLQTRKAFDAIVFMAQITALNELAAVFTIEFESKLYFRVEILRVETTNVISSTTYFAEVYQLRLPHGTSGMPHQGTDCRWRQFLHYLDDFQMVSANSIEAVREEVVRNLSLYADEYFCNYSNKVLRAQPGR